MDNSECFGVKFVKIYPEMTSPFFLKKYGIGWLYSDYFYMRQYFWPHTVYLTRVSIYEIDTTVHKGTCRSTATHYPDSDQPIFALPP